MKKVDKKILIGLSTIVLMVVIVIGILLYQNHRVSEIEKKIRPNPEPVPSDSEKTSLGFDETQMEEPLSFKEKVLHLISKGKVKEALSLSLSSISKDGELYNDINLLMGECNRLFRKGVIGIIGPDEKERKLNSLSFRLMGALEIVRD